MSRIGSDVHGVLIAVTARGTAVFDGSQWRAKEPGDPAFLSRVALGTRQFASLRKLAGAEIAVRAVAEYQGEMAVAADSGLYLCNGRNWRLALPQQGLTRWAPIDVRAVAYDASGALWFACPQGVGFRLSDKEWKLFTGADGLPYNDFTCMAIGPKGIWFGTTNGAVHYRDGVWSFRQGRRWLLNNHVRDITVDAQGNAWIATADGVSCIAYQPMTLAGKAAIFESDIEKYHRRTRFGYVNPAKLATPGDRGTATPTFTDNDGHGTGLYLGAVSLGYAATGNPKLKQDAVNAFRALAFLSKVTEGGTHPAPKGFIARAVRPTSEPDPNPQFDLAYDVRRKKADSLWKIIQPRWPIDASGEWYWKNDSSSDELDGHFFGYAIYFDRVCETDAEANEVREVVRRIIDHILAHGYNLVDYDGLPTRWGHLAPEDLNRNEAWCIERGLNSFSMLTYLSIAHHVTGDPKYREAYLKLALDHGYGMNGMTQPKDISGPGTFGQPDDNMAFMNYYHLIRYETDPKLLSMYYHAIQRHWQIEKYERNAFENVVYAACCRGKVRSDQWGETDLSPPKYCFDDAIDTLKRYPLDLIDWPMSNAHRIDMIPLQDHLGQPAGATGHRIDGRVFPIDERHEVYWDRDPWILSYSGKGAVLREGFHYLLAYYMGRAHGFIGE
ncbi:MAG: hypothetical protein HZB26_13955 [Candidatus Hydrogenedentes bacterium]|nr:hypothetical protein [Candidatus Hydrogenedentota bacterium]